MSVKGKIACPGCGFEIEVYRNPVPTVDIIIEVETSEGKGIVLIERKNFPFGWAIPGGFVDYGEPADAAAVREAKEETGLDVELLYLLGVYSQPDRDPRQHTLSAVFVARAHGRPEAGDDAKSLQVFPPNKLPSPLAFDHHRILSDYLAGKRGIWG